MQPELGVGVKSQALTADPEVLMLLPATASWGKKSRDPKLVAVTLGVLLPHMAADVGGLTRSHPTSDATRSLSRSLFQFPFFRWWQGVEAEW